MTWFISQPISAEDSDTPHSKIEAIIHTPSLDTLTPPQVDPTPWN